MYENEQVMEERLQSLHDERRKVENIIIDATVKI